MNTGFPQLDKLIGGLTPSDLVVIGAQPGIGKTILAMNIAQYAASVEGKRVAVFSLSHNADQINSCFLCSRALVDVRSYWSGEISDSQKGRIQEAEEFFSKRDIFIDDTPGISAPYMKRRLDRLGGADLVIVDCLQLMNSGSNLHRAVPSSRVIAKTVKELKSAAEELNVPIIATSAMKRPNDGDIDAGPKLSGLRGPKTIADVADVVFLLHRPYITSGMTKEEIDSIDPSYAEIMVAKNNHGRTGTVPVKLQYEYLRFMPWTSE